MSRLGIEIAEDMRDLSRQMQETQMQLDKNTEDMQQALEEIRQQRKLPDKLWIQVKKGD